MSHLDYLNKTYPVRRTKEEKKAFQNYVLEYINTKTQSGLNAQLETTKDGKNENIIIGNPLEAKVVCTAHYDTPMHSLFPNIMIPRNKAVFLLYQFVPVLLLVIISFAPIFVIHKVHPLTSRQVALIFLIIYYVAYYLMYFARKNPNNYNDNTSGVALLLTLAEKLSAEQAKDVAFILFDNEEKGKKGSKAYVKDHKDIMGKKFLLNFDCVANGETFLFASMDQAEQCPEYALLQQCFTTEAAAGAGYDICYYPMKTTQSNSDHKNFPCGIGCMAYKKASGGLLYTPNIHTPKDVVVDNKNIEFLTEHLNKFFERIAYNR